MQDFPGLIEDDCVETADELLRVSLMCQLEMYVKQNGIDLITEPEENWRLSQFWYDKETKTVLGNIIQKLVAEANPSTKNDYRIALVSCPSLYNTVKVIHKNVNVFEYDKRFESLGEDYIYYDFNLAEKEDYLIDKHKQYNLIVADPPYLSEDCVLKTCNVVKNLLVADAGKIIFCSGTSIEKWVCPALNVKKSSYEPKHERNLGNEFACYANFDLDKYIA